MKTGRILLTTMALLLMGYLFYRLGYLKAAEDAPAIVFNQPADIAHIKFVHNKKYGISLKGSNSSVNNSYFLSCEEVQ